MSIDEGVHYEASLDKVRIAYACYHDDYRLKGRTTEQWWGIRDKAMAEFDDWFRQQKADAWDEGRKASLAYEALIREWHNLRQVRFLEDMPGYPDILLNPYREANDDE